jgi:Lsr2
MARIETLVDDYDGTVAAEGVEVETRRFSIGRTSYTIDLTADNYDAFLKDLEKWTEKATQEESPNRAVRPSAPRKSSAAASGGDKPYTASQVRAWAETDDRFKGKVSPRGRIHRDVEEAYEHAHHLKKDK